MRISSNLLAKTKRYASFSDVLKQTHQKMTPLHSPQETRKVMRQGQYSSSYHSLASLAFLQRYHEKDIRRKKRSFICQSTPNESMSQDMLHKAHSRHMGP